MASLFSITQFKDRIRASGLPKRLGRALLGRWKKVKSIKPRSQAKRWAQKAKRLKRRVSGSMISGPQTLADNIRFFANPGPQFEPADKLTAEHLPSRATTIAFYLPQFHAFDENDRWWGKGFTEWRNVARGTPRYRGHYQPRIPSDLGFYDLSDVNTIKAQSDLAKRNGIDAFCFYYYWFNGKRLMTKPLDLFADSNIDQQFCIMWANENWTRTWDGMDNDVLIEQNYLEQDEDDFIADTASYMANDRYVRMNDQPLFILYRPGLLPGAKTTIARWRKKWHKLLGETPLVMMVQGFGEEDPREFGLDGAVEFPPHKVCAGLKNINDRCHVLDSNYRGLVRSYQDVIDKSLGESAPEFPLIKTVSPHWDNDARREGLGMTMHGSTPALYEQWLNGAIDFAIENPVFDQSLVFVNAWNEWAEGAYLEPDVHFGHAYLNATKRAIKGLSAQSGLGRILLIGHDAHQHGAQMLLFNMAKIYRQQFGMDVVIALKEGGPLVEEYKKITKTVVLSKLGKNGLSKLLARYNFTSAICNTTVTGDLVPELRKAGVQVVSLIHELPSLIKDYQLESRVQTIAEKAHHVVFAANKVQAGFESFCETKKPNAIIRPQGTYAPVTYDERTRHNVRDALGIGINDKVVLGVGYADLRKGFDLFMDAARRGVVADPKLHFVWAGALSADMQRWIQPDFSSVGDSRRIHILGFTNRVTEFYSAADCLFLSSREDPYPTVVLEAMNVGLPVLCYQGCTGFDSLMGDHGYLVDIGHPAKLDAALYKALNDTNKQSREQRIEHVETQCRFDDYCFTLLELLHPDIKRVSVVVNDKHFDDGQGMHLEQQLSSIFAQNYPIFEVLLLSKSSKDSSRGLAQSLAKNCGRRLESIEHDAKVGGPYKLWEEAATRTRGDLLWVCDAGEGTDSRFVSQLIEAFDNSTALGYFDSKPTVVNSDQLSEQFLQQLDADLQYSISKDSTSNISGLMFNRAILLAYLRESENVRAQEQHPDENISRAA